MQLVRQKRMGVRDTHTVYSVQQKELDPEDKNTAEC